MLRIHSSQIFQDWGRRGAQCVSKRAFRHCSGSHAMILGQRLKCSGRVAEWVLASGQVTASRPRITRSPGSPSRKAEHVRWQGCPIHAGCQALHLQRSRWGVLVRMLSHPRLHPSLRSAVWCRRRRTRGIDPRDSCGCRGQEGSSQVSTWTPLPRCTDVFSTRLWGWHNVPSRMDSQTGGLSCRDLQALLSNRLRRLQGDMFMLLTTSASTPVAPVARAHGHLVIKLLVWSR